MTIVYEPHPVSKERKTELRGKGFTIIDARFKPKELAESEPEKPAKAVKNTKAKPAEE